MARKQLSMCKRPRLLAFALQAHPLQKQKVHGLEACGTQAAKHMQLASPGHLSWLIRYTAFLRMRTRGMETVRVHKAHGAQAAAHMHLSRVGSWAYERDYTGVHHSEGKCTRSEEEARVREAHRAQAAEHVQQRRGALEEHLDGRAEQRHAVAVQPQRAAHQAQAVVQHEACEDEVRLLGCQLLGP